LSTCPPPRQDSKMRKALASILAVSVVRQGTARSLKRSPSPSQSRPPSLGTTGSPPTAFHGRTRPTQVQSCSPPQVGRTQVSAGPTGPAR
jgi:hypothetical protein